ncbi:hypothetical protein ACIBF6_44175 [Streptosporangium amethystogenes]|uniref:hypothetical protein n=1 Tax=Streptosporangium amethystogenes TaxID=2002 RepID=UPI0037BC6459
MSKTRATKCKSTVTKMVRSYKAVIDAPAVPGPALRSPCGASRGSNWFPAVER